MGLREEASKPESGNLLLMRNTWSGESRESKNGMVKGYGAAHLHYEYQNRERNTLKEKKVGSLYFGPTCRKSSREKKKKNWENSFLRKSSGDRAITSLDSSNLL